MVLEEGWGRLQPWKCPEDRAAERQFIPPNLCDRSLPGLPEARPWSAVTEGLWVTSRPGFLKVQELERKLCGSKLK